MGEISLVNPEGTVAEIGSFQQQGDTVKISLDFTSHYAPVLNIVTLICDLVPGGDVVQPQTLVDDFSNIDAIYNAGQLLFCSNAHTVPQWTQAVGKAIWSLRDLAKNQAESQAVSNLLDQLGAQVTEEGLSSAINIEGLLDLIKIVSSEVVYLSQTGGNKITCTFQAYPGGGTGGSSPSSLVNSNSVVGSQAQSGSTSANVTWTTTPSPTDWTVNYNLTNQGTAPMWNFSVFYEPSVGPPLAVNAPTGWVYQVDSVGGTVTWYSQGPNGWTNGDFGTTAIQPGASLSGFTVRHTCPPAYSLSCATDANYATAYNPVPPRLPPRASQVRSSALKASKKW